MNPTVSVIIPSYNHAHFLPFSVESVLRQTFADYEIVIVDDGSTDNSQQVVAQYSDSRIRYIFQKNKGLAGARNTGIREARGEYLAFLDADDLFAETKLEVQVGWLRDHPSAGLVAGGWNLIDDKGHILEVYHPGPDFPDMSLKGWLRDCHVCPVSLLVRRDWVVKIGGFDETLRQVEDWDMWLRLAYAGCPMGWVDEIVCSYRLSAGQMTKNAAVQKYSSVQMMDKFYCQTDLPLDVQKMRADLYTRVYLIGAGREFGVGQWEEAQSSVRKAVELSPQLKENWGAEPITLLFGWEDSAYNRSENRMSSITFYKNVFLNLPEQASALRKQERRLMGEAGEKTFYWAYSKQNWRLVRQAALVLLRNSPRILANKGFWSILIKSLFHLRNN